MAGNINNAGLVEVPMGITLREIVYDIGGGIPFGKELKAVQTGGPSGGFIPSELLDLSVDYDRLQEAGAIMGSGGMIVVDTETCMVDMAKYFLEFTRSESCGRCNSCREGLSAMYEILDNICSGNGKDGDIELLEDLSNAVKDASLCALGRTAPNPVLTTLRYFRDEYEAHINEGRCPAGACKALITYSIDPEKCKACMLCVKNCPVGAISGEAKQPQVIDEATCIRCGACRDFCKFEAVVIQ